MGNPNYADGDDINIKGDDGTAEGTRITSTTDGSKKRLDVATQGNIDDSGSQDVMDHEHYMIHQGRAYHYSTYASGITNGTVTNFIIATPAAAPYIHFRHSIWIRDKYLIELYEGATYTGGSTATLYNKNRVSANTANVVIKTTPTITGTGTLIWSENSGGAVGTSANKSNTDGIEWILKASTNYLFRITAQAASNAYSLGINWYEAGL